MKRITGQQLADAAVAAIPMGILYKDEMCDRFVRNSFKRAGGDMGRYAETRDMFRNALSCMYPLDMAKKNGTLVPGALLFIVSPGYDEKYKDNLGLVSHVGIYTGAPEAEVMHSSESRGGVFPSTLKNGWTHAGLPKAATFGTENADIPTSEDGTVETEPLRVYAPDGGKVKMRAEPNGQAIVLEYIDTGIIVQSIPKRQGDWQMISFNGKYGWMMKEFLFADEYIEEPKGRGGEINMPTPHRIVLPSKQAGETVNFRKEPDPQSIVLKRIPDWTEVVAGDEFTQAGQKWKRVVFEGSNGYVMSKYLEPTSGSTDQPPYFPFVPPDLPDLPGANQSEAPKSLEDRVKRIEDWLTIVLKETGIDKRFGGM